MSAGDRAAQSQWRASRRAWAAQLSRLLCTLPSVVGALEAAQELVLGGRKVDAGCTTGGTEVCTINFDGLSI